MKLIYLDLIHLNYPFITTEMKWTKDDIQFFYDNKLLLGIIDNYGTLSIEIESLENLIQYHRKVAIEQKKNNLG